MDTSIPAIIDIEASGFGKDSYPIEVGIVFADGEKFCRLIRPEKNWTYWDPDAESIHRISRTILESKGNFAKQVAYDLNERLVGMRVYSDCWTVDKPWLDALYFAANTTPTFRVSAIEMILSESQWEKWGDTHTLNLEQYAESRHRASSDAEMIQKTWLDTRASASKNVPHKKAG